MLGNILALLELALQNLSVIFHALNIDWLAFGRLRIRSKVVGVHIPVGEDMVLVESRHFCGILTDENCKIGKSMRFLQRV